MYVCNAMTEHGETDGFYVSDCVKQINKYVKADFIDIVIANSKLIPEDIQKLYSDFQDEYLNLCLKLKNKNLLLFRINLL